MPLRIVLVVNILRLVGIGDEERLGDLLPGVIEGGDAEGKPSILVGRLVPFGIGVEEGMYSLDGGLEDAGCVKC